MYVYLGNLSILFIIIIKILGSESQDTGNILLLYCYEEKKATNWEILPLLLVGFLQYSLEVVVVVVVVVAVVQCDSVESMVMFL